MHRKLKFLLGGACALASIAVTTTASAQDVAPDQSDVADAAAEDTIVVTGSNIRRSAAESSVPLQVLGSQDIAESGTTDLFEAIEELPGVSDGVSPQGSVSSVQTSGLSTISLRRLGDNRTLILINGHRAVSNSGNSDRVSLDTIPAGFVKRVEITTGGASAIYGSDAVAGVANIVLRQDLKGLTLDGRYSAPKASGGREYHLEGTYGMNFASDAGYLMIGASYRDEQAIYADRSRPKSIRAVEFDNPALGAADSFAGETCNSTNPNQQCILPDFSGSTPGGVFEGGDAWHKDGVWYNDMALRPSDRTGTQDFYSDFDGYNTRPGRSLRPSREILNLGLFAAIDLSDDTRYTLSALYSDVDTDYVTDYETLDNGDAYGLLDAFTVGDMAANHPFIHPAVAATRSGTVSFDRRLVELGRNHRINNRETFRVFQDLSGRFSDKLEWTVFGTYGRFLQVQDNPNEVNFARAKEALAIEPDGAGGFRCTSAAARARGCVPLNLFGEGSITPQAADYIRYNGHGSQTREQITAGATVRSDQYDVLGMGLRFAAGAEFRREEQSTRGDPDGDLIGGIDGNPATNDVLVTSLATFPSIQASYDVIETFAEVDLEVIPDKLNLQAAGRYADYSTIGGIFSYNLGAVWNVTGDLRLRGQYSRSQRAPNLTEFYSTARPDSDDLIDPCSGLLANGTGLSAPRSVGGADVDLAVVRANCLASPGIQAFFANPANAGLAFLPGGTTQGPNAGNQNLKEESADTWTAGFVYSPKWLPGVTLIADYYRIAIKDTISSVDTQNVVDLCYSSADFPNNRFCDVITRNATNGQVVEVINQLENLNHETVEGLDASLTWNHIDLGLGGEFDLDLRYTHYFTQAVSFNDLAGNPIVDSSLGQIGTSEDELRFKLGYRNGGLRLNYTVTYESGGVDDLVNGPNPGDEFYYAVKGQDYHRIYASYEFGPDDRFKIYGGVNNLFDSFGPLVPTGTLTGSTYNIASPLNDSLGREFYVGASAKF